MRVTFTCGHDLIVPPQAGGHPTCRCGESRVLSVAGARPSFRGACHGPFAQFDPDVGKPAPVNLVVGEPLTLKEQDRG